MAEARTFNGETHPSALGQSSSIEPVLENYETIQHDGNQMMATKDTGLAFDHDDGAYVYGSAGVNPNDNIFVNVAEQGNLGVRVDASAHYEVMPVTDSYCDSNDENWQNGAPVRKPARSKSKRTRAEQDNYSLRLFNKGKKDIMADIERVSAMLVTPRMVKNKKDQSDYMERLSNKGIKMKESPSPSPPRGRQQKIPRSEDEAAGDLENLNYMNSEATNHRITCYSPVRKGTTNISSSHQKEYLSALTNKGRKAVSKFVRPVDEVAVAIAQYSRRDVNNISPNISSKRSKSKEDQSSYMDRLMKRKESRHYERMVENKDVMRSNSAFKPTPPVSNPPTKQSTAASPRAAYRYSAPSRVAHSQRAQEPHRNPAIRDPPAEASAHHHAASRSPRAMAHHPHATVAKSKSNSSSRHPDNKPSHPQHQKQQNNRDVSGRVPKTSKALEFCGDANNDFKVNKASLDAENGIRDAIQTALRRIEGTLMDSWTVSHTAAVVESEEMPECFHSPSSLVSIDNAMQEDRLLQKQIYETSRTVSDYIGHIVSTDNVTDGRLLHRQQESAGIYTQQHHSDVNKQTLRPLPPSNSRVSMPRGNPARKSVFLTGHDEESDEEDVHTQKSVRSNERGYAEMPLLPAPAQMDKQGKARQFVSWLNDNLDELYVHDSADAGGHQGMKDLLLDQINGMFPDNDKAKDADAGDFDAKKKQMHRRHEVKFTEAKAKPSMVKKKPSGVVPKKSVPAESGVKHMFRPAKAPATVYRDPDMFGDPVAGKPKIPSSARAKKKLPHRNNKMAKDNMSKPHRKNNSKSTGVAVHSKNGKKKPSGRAVSLLQNNERVLSSITDLINSFDQSPSGSKNDGGQFPVTHWPRSCEDPTAIKSTSDVYSDGPSDQTGQEKKSMISSDLSSYFAWGGMNGHASDEYVGEDNTDLHAIPEVAEKSLQCMSAADPFLHPHTPPSPNAIIVDKLTMSSFSEDPYITVSMPTPEIAPASPPMNFHRRHKSTKEVIVDDGEMKKL